MKRTQEVFHDHPKHSQTLCASTINLALFLIVIIMNRLLGGHTYNHSQTPYTILVFLYVKSVQMEQYHLYKTHMHSYAIVYSCIQK